MKRIIHILLMAIIPVITFAGTKKTPVPVKVKVKNNGKAIISKLVLANSQRDTFHYNNIKAGKTSSYRELTSLCNCQYEVDITYLINKKEVTVHQSCVNIRACDDFYTGKYMIEVTAPKKGIPADGNVKLSFRQQ